jgi:hypothetical protein
MVGNTEMFFLFSLVPLSDWVGPQGLLESADALYFFSYALRPLIGYGLLAYA